jgi:hypothetical protein
VADARTDIAPAGWQITATTIKCGMVDDLITIMVYKDWSAGCVWYNKYKKVAAENPRQKFSRDIKAKLSGCCGPDCSYVMAYRDKLIAEEEAAGK